MSLQGDRPGATDNTTESQYGVSTVGCGSPAIRPGRRLVHDRYYEAALKWCSDWLDYELEDLPLGVPGNADWCPIARATGLLVDCEGALYGPSNQHIEFPEDVSRFVERFDSGHYPRLETSREAL